MTDLIERLRIEWRRLRISPQSPMADLCDEAANEIQRLRREMWAERDENARLREEFDRLERAYQQLRETYLNTGKHDDH